MAGSKQFDIDKFTFVMVFDRGKAKGGSAGVDGVQY